MILPVVCCFWLLTQQQAVSPLAMTVTTDKQTYISGETVRVVISLENRTDKPIVIARVIWDGAIAAGCRPVLTRGGQRIETEKGSTCPAVQVCVSPSVTEDRFLTLAPGKKVAVYREWFSEERDFHGHSPNLKASFRYMTTAPLSPGEYVIEAKYHFGRDKGAWMMEGSNWEFQSERAKKLFYSAWTGELAASTGFRVLPKPE
ncbi:MAG: hypothetical protein HRF45_00445 [Fimbriimonadia bacterium]|jgi:hypothetical protein